MFLDLYQNLPLYLLTKYDGTKTFITAFYSKNEGTLSGRLGGGLLKSVLMKLL